MTSHDPDDDALPAEPDGNEDKKPVDLRFTKVEQSGVRLDRDMSGQGHLARGSHTHMSNMRFSVRAQPRSEPDPELQALRPKEADAPKPDATEPDATKPVATEPDATGPVESKDEQQQGGMFAAIKRLFE